MSSAFHQQSLGRATLLPGIGISLPITGIPGLGQGTITRSGEDCSWSAPTFLYCTLLIIAFLI